MSLAFRTPTITTSRFGAAKSQSPEAGPPPPGDFFAALVDLAAQESGEAEGGFSERIADFSERLSTLRNALVQNQLSQDPCLEPLARSRGSSPIVGGSRLPPTEEELRNAHSRLEGLEDLVGGTAGSEPLASQARLILRALNDYTQKLRDPKFSQDLAVVEEKAALLSKNIDAFQAEAIFKPADVSAINDACDYAQEWLALKPAVDEMSQRVQRFEEMCEEGGQADKDFDAEIEEIEALLIANDAVIEQCMSNFFPKIIVAARALQMI